MLERRGDRLGVEHKSSRRKYYTSVSKAVDTIHTRRTTTSVVGEGRKKFFHTPEFSELERRKAQEGRTKSSFCGVEKIRI